MEQFSTESQPRTTVTGTRFQNRAYIENGALVLTNLKSADAGIYYCLIKAYDAVKFETVTIRSTDSYLSIGGLLRLLTKYWLATSSAVKFIGNTLPGRAIRGVGSIQILGTHPRGAHSQAKGNNSVGCRVALNIQTASRFLHPCISYNQQWSLRVPS